MDANIIVKIVKGLNIGVKILGISLITFIICLHIHIARNIVPSQNGITIVEYRPSVGKKFYYIELPDKKIRPVPYNPESPLLTMDGQKVKPGKIKVVKQIKLYDYQGLELVDIGDCPSFLGTKGWSLLYQNQTDEKRKTIFGFGTELFFLLAILILFVKIVQFSFSRVYFLDKELLSSTANFLIIDLILFTIAAFLTIVAIY